MKALILLTSLLLPLSSFAESKSSSIYTSVAVKDCKTIESSENEAEPEIDYYTGHCEGKNGYTVQISGGDIRYSLSLIYGGEQVEFTRIGAFHDMGSDKVEWRGKVNKDGSVTKFHSLIYRLNIHGYGENYDESRDSLFVVRLNGKKSCLIGQVEQSKNMNAEARKIADDMSKKCIPLD